MKKITLYILLFTTLFCAAQQPYYSSIDFSKTGIPLKNDLAALITSTHTNTLSYGWGASQATDINPNDSSKVLLLYGWENGSDGDCTNDLERNTNGNGGNVCDWNREHVYAKSRATPSMSNSGPGADGHHIRATDVQRNGQRDNKLFATGSGNSTVVGANWYPGDEWKGDVARVIMYMWLRYGSQCLPSNIAVGTNNTVEPEMINLLLDWNASDEVSDYEIQRNTYHDGSSTYSQGNRNPFIDNPYLATSIWGGTPATDTWGILGIEDYADSNFKIYPNPTYSSTVFINKGNNTINQLELYSISGKLIISKKINTQNSVITLDNLDKVASGMYLLKIHTDKNSVVKKLVIN